eukprot:766407-Hanusia_phi.AAC.2
MRKAASKYEECSPEEIDRHYQEYLKVFNITQGMFAENEEGKKSMAARGELQLSDEDEDKDLVPDFLPENLEAWKTRNLREEMCQVEEPIMGVVPDYVFMAQLIIVADKRLEKWDIPQKIYCFSLIEVVVLHSCLWLSGCCQTYRENWIASNASQKEEEYVSDLKDKILRLLKSNDFAQVETHLEDILRLTPVREDLLVSDLYSHACKDCVPALVFRGSMIAGLTLKYRRREKDTWDSEVSAVCDMIQLLTCLGLYKFLRTIPMPRRRASNERARSPVNVLQGCFLQRVLRHSVRAVKETRGGLKPFDVLSSDSSKYISSTDSFQHDSSSEVLRKNCTLRLMEAEVDDMGLADPNLDLFEIEDKRIVKNLTRAKSDLERAYQLDPQNHPAVCNLATLLTYFPNTSAAYPYIGQVNRATAAGQGSHALSGQRHRPAGCSLLHQHYDKPPQLCPSSALPCAGESDFAMTDHQDEGCQPSAPCCATPYSHLSLHPPSQTSRRRLQVGHIMDVLQQVRTLSAVRASLLSCFCKVMSNGADGRRTSSRSLESLILSPRA